MPACVPVRLGRITSRDPLQGHIFAVLGAFDRQLIADFVRAGSNRSRNNRFHATKVFGMRIAMCTASSIF